MAEGYADLGLSAFDYALDKYHDRAYDAVAHVPRHVRRLSTRLRRRRPPGQQEEAVEIERPPIGPDNPINQFRRHNQQRVPPRFDMSGYGDGYGSESGYTRSARSGKGVDNETYEPTGYNMQNTAARDGYAPGNGYADPDGRAPQPAYAPTSGYAGSAYDAEEGRPRQRYLEYDRREYGDPRSRSYDDVRRSRYADEEEDYDYGYERRLERRKRDRSRDRDRERSRSKSRGGSRRGGSDDEDEGDGNTQLKKWGATLAGAAVGAYGGHRAKKDHWVPAAIGAVVGGLVAREAEKEFVKHRHEKREERRYEEGYRSRSR